MKKIICVFLVAICLVTVCFATFDETSLNVDSSITLPDSIIQSIQLFSETMNYVVIRCDSSFNYVYYITGMGNATGTVSIGQFVMFTYDSTSVNYSNDGVFTYANIFVYDSDGTQTDSRRYQTGYTVLPSCFTIVQSKGFTFNGEDYVVEDTTIESEEDKEYKSGVLGWLQNLSETISGGLDNVINKIGMFFNPCHEDFEVDFGTFIDNSLQNNFTFIEKFKTAFDNFSNLNEPLVIEEEVTIGSKSYTFRIDLAFYESYRFKIRSGISTIFYVATFLCIVQMLKSTLGVQFGGSAGAGSSEGHSFAHYDNIQTRSNQLNSYLDRWGS